MKTYLYFSNIREEDCSAEIAKVISKELKYDLKFWGENKSRFYVKIPAGILKGSREHRKLIETFRKFGISPEPWRIEEKWTHEELLKSVLMYFEIESDIDIGSSRFSRAGYLYIDKKALGKKPIEATRPQGDIVVSQGVKDLIEENKLTGVEFKKTKDKKKRDINFPISYHLIVTHKLPPMAADVKFHIEEYGKSGKIDRVYFLPASSLPHYKKKDLKEIKDFNLSHEGITGFYCITPRVYEVFRKIKGAKFHFSRIRVD